MNIYPDLQLAQTPDQKPPTKKVLYFSDGTLEVDEDDVDASEDSTASHARAPSDPLTVNPQQLPWLPWMWHHTLTAGTKALEVCDYVGESLASFFGITTPKYQFEINEYMKIKKAEEEESQNEMEMKRWTKGGQFPEGVTNTMSQPACAFNPV